MRVPVGMIAVTQEATIAQVMKVINGNQQGMALVLSVEDTVKGLVTDGDIRRGFLKGLTIDDSVEKIMTDHPIVATDSMSIKEMHDLMIINTIQHLPIVDSQGRVVGVEVLTVAQQDTQQPLTAVIMAGGEGQRLRPLTENMPKPMLKVAGKPLLEILIDKLREEGFSQIIINVRYLSDVIEDHFGDGERVGIKIDYIREPKPLGTAGSLSLIPSGLMPKGPFLVINGDILTALHFKTLHDFHVAADYDFTLCGRPYQVQIPFGYPKIEGDLVVDFQEKPSMTHLVNSGIYCLSPDLIDFVPECEYFDMPTLIRRALTQKKRVGVFPLREKFHEIGRVESFEAAEEFYSKHLQPSTIQESLK